jgi:hypothetical protein
MEVTEKIVAAASVTACKMVLLRVRGMRCEFGRKEIAGEANSYEVVGGRVQAEACGAVIF